MATRVQVIAFAREDGIAEFMRGPEMYEVMREAVGRAADEIRGGAPVRTGAGRSSIRGRVLMGSGGWIGTASWDEAHYYMGIRNTRREFVEPPLGGSATSSEEDRAVALTDDDRELMELQRSLSASGATVAGLPSGAAVAADPEVIRTWELRQAAQREAYGQYVANGDIYLGNCLTFASGQPVPLEHVIRFDLEDREQVNRVATPELARRGKVFDSDEAFLAANPHVVRQARSLRAAGDLHPSALDPRGGGAAIDDARKAGKTVDVPTAPGDGTDERQEAVLAQAEELADAAEHPAAPDEESGGGGKATGKTSESGASGATKRGVRSSSDSKTPKGD